MNNYLETIKVRFKHYKSIAERAIDQLPEEALFWQPNEESNSIAIIVKHLWGNMMSRWTDFLNTDGEKEWRHRDTEFESDINSKKEMMSKWLEGWDCLFKALDSIDDEDLTRTIYIRNEGHTVADAINRQLAHYSYHIGQIVFISKIKSENWEALTIPKGHSEAFNKEKFAKPNE